MSKMARSIGCLTLLLPWLAGWFDAVPDETAWASTVGTVATRLGAPLKTSYSIPEYPLIRFHSQISVKTTTTTTTNLREVYETVANVCTYVSSQKLGTSTPPP